MTAYAEKLTDPRWQKKRLQIFERDGWKCTICSDEGNTLNVHHEKYVGDNPWDTPDEFLKTLCQDCHSIIGCFDYIKSRGTLLKTTKLQERADPSDYMILASCIFGGKKKLVVIMKNGDRYTLTPVSSVGVERIKEFISDFHILNHFNA